MKKSKILIGCIVLVMLVSYCKNSPIHLPGQGNWEEECLNDTRWLDSEFHRLGIDCWFHY